MNIPDASASNRPSSELDIYDRATSPGVDDSTLKDWNLGMGNYDKHTMWEQVKSFRKGLYAEAAFERMLLERAKEEAKHAMAVEAWNGLSPDERNGTDRRQFIREKKTELWDALEPHISEYNNEQERRKLRAQREWEKIQEHTNINRGFTPPHFRMLMARHETSRSLGARLIDNLFQRVTEYRGEEPDTSGIFGGKG